MAGFVHDAQQDFWHSPAGLQPVTDADAAPIIQGVAEACGSCGSEYMIGARFCHTCGLRRPLLAENADSDAASLANVWGQKVLWVRTSVGSWINSSVSYWRKISFPDWLRYLHFHEIKRCVGLPTASLIAFFIGLGCIVGGIGVGLFYKASTLAEFQAIQMWRIEWLLAATASFVAGILLKTSSGPNND
jgi:hypothetical protein